MKSLLNLSTLVLAAAAGGVSAQTTFPDLAVDLLGPSTLQIGRSDRYLLKITNLGSQVATNAVAVVSLPPGLGLYRPTPPTGCGYNTSQRRLTCTISTLAVNTTSTVRIDLKSIGAAPSTEPVQVSVSVAGEPAANTGNNSDAVSTNVGSYTPTLTFPIAQALYLCNGNKDILAANCYAIDAVYGAHGAFQFDAGGVALLTNGNSFVAQQVSNTSLVVNLWTADGRNTVVWDMTPFSATCWQGNAYRLDAPGSVFYEVRLCQP
jgi:Domain of unknown function DUF11